MPGRSGLATFSHGASPSIGSSNPCPRRCSILCWSSRRITQPEAGSAPSALSLGGTFAREMGSHSPDSWRWGGPMASTMVFGGSRSSRPESLDGSQRQLRQPGATVQQLPEVDRLVAAPRRPLRPLRVLLLNLIGLNRIKSD